MSSKKNALYDIAYARSGDKGSSANIGIVAYTPEGFAFLQKELTEQKVAAYFKLLQPKKVIRYELPNLGALNFVLEGVLGEGGSRSLRIDPQGKALGQALLEMIVDIPSDQLAKFQKNSI